MQLPGGFDLGNPGGLDSLRGSAFEGLGSFQGLRGSTFEGLRGSNFEGHVNELRGAMFYVCKVIYNFEFLHHAAQQCATTVNVMLPWHLPKLKFHPINKCFRLPHGDLIFGASCRICW